MHIKMYFVMCLNKIMTIAASMTLCAAAFAQNNFHYEGNTVTVVEPGANVSTTPIIADESICGDRFTETVVLDQFPATRGNLRYVDDFQALALSQLAKEHDADFIITTQVNVCTQDGCFAVTVTGYPARYENFRKPTQEDMELLRQAKAPGYGMLFCVCDNPYNSRGRTYYAGLIEVPRFNIHPGFQQMLDLSLIGTDDTALELTYTAGYRFTNAFYLGGGAGVAYSWWQEDVYIPVYITPMFYITRRRVAPVVGLRLGINASVVGTGIDRVLVSPLIDLRPGIRVHTNSGNDINVSLTFGSRPDIYNDTYGKAFADPYVEGGMSVGFSF